MQREGLTVPYVVQGAPLRSLRVEVVKGPDRGRIAERAAESLTIGTADDNDLVLTDDTVSRYHTELRTLGDRVQVIDHGSTNGTSVGSARFNDGSIQSGTVLTLGKTFVKVTDGEPLEVELSEAEDLHGLRGKSPAMRRLMARIERVAGTDVSVLLQGETGTGKEVVSRAIHLASRRADKPLEVVDCGALMPSLVASELFGHEKGAFTGANQQYIGAFERANGGTIFLDEIGELTPDLQVRLLGVLERRRFRRVGGSKPVDVDVRVIAATHRDLRQRVNANEFRQDLYYRIAVARLDIPPLRERADDIPMLAEHFLSEMGIDEPLHQVLQLDALTTLQRYQWPGNVRELRNFVESAVAFGGDTTVPDDTLPPQAGEKTAADWAKYLDLKYRDARDSVLRDFQRVYFERLLAQHGDNVTRTAETAQLSRPHLVQILKAIGLRG